MTQNQIRLGELRETIRHNQAVESSTRDTNRINEEHYVRADTVSQAQAAEIGRHNLESEKQQNVQLVINRNALSEQIRHNKESEAIGYGNIGVGYAQANAAMASAAAAGVSAAAAMKNAETSALIAPSTLAYNYARTADAYSHVGVNTSQSAVNKSQAGLNTARTIESDANARLIHSKTDYQNYVNQIQLPIQTNQMKSNLVNTWADTAEKGSRAVNNWSQALNRTMDIAFKGSKLFAN